MLQLNLLGEQRLTDARADVGAGTSRALELLAYLVLHPDLLVARMVVSGTFWPESTDAQTPTNLHRELHNLRSMRQPVPRQPEHPVVRRPIHWPHA